MVEKLIIFFIGYFIGILSLIVFCSLKVSADSNKRYERKEYLNYGQDAYNELEKREKENGLSK